MVRNSWSPMDSRPEVNVDVIINTIENFVRRNPITITILVRHGENVLGESEPLRIEPDFREPPLIHEINYRTRFPLIVSDRSSIDSAVSIPLLIQLVEHESSDFESKPVSSATGDGKKRDKTKSSRKSANHTGPKIIGLCNIDIIPIILGEKNINERLILEEPIQSSTIGATPWMDLPVLTVTLDRDENNLLPPDFVSNYLSITVESIHNLPVSFTEGLEYKAATVVCIDSEEPEIVIFDGGKLTKYRDVEFTKRWRTLDKVEGRGAHSKYKIDCDYGNTKNSLETVDVKRILGKDSPRIEWSSLSRHILLSTGQEMMRNNINEYKHWPFQFRITSNVLDNGKRKSRDSRPQLYQCYVDLSELLYPGRTQTRSTAQLYTHNTGEMMEKTGFDQVLFADVITDTKEKEKKGKLGTKGSSVAHLPPVESDTVSSSPLINNTGEPVFVIIQFELQKPLVLGRTTDEIIGDLRDILGPPDKLSPYAYTGDLAEEQYSHCIKKLVETFTESYRDFIEEDEKAKDLGLRNGSSQTEKSKAPGRKYSYIPDEIDRFTQYLYETGTYVAAQTSLKNKIAQLLDQTFKIESCTWHSEECQNIVAKAYLYLIEQMHVALNNENVNEFDSGTIDSVDKLWYSAEENYELENIERAKNSYTDAIAYKRSDPDVWLRYAIFLKKTGDIERAIQCCREAINLNSRHKLALLLYGVLLTEKEDYTAAEIFLKATTQLYPRFGEAWAILHLFYLRTEYFPGVDLTIHVAEECLIEQERDTYHMDCLENEPLAWSTIHCTKDRVYLIIAVFLLKLNLFDFAGIALAQELSLAGRSTSWLYYMAVHHYLLGRYDDALTHLKEAQRKHGMDYSISGFMGHCYFKENDVKSAMECYEFASTFFDRPSDVHLIDLRMGNYLLDVEEYTRAKKIFFNVCKLSPTSNSWLGLGIACYNMMDFENAEIALTEANRLEHNNPEIWAYLCLLNMSLQRYDEFAECYRQTVKNELRKSKLWLCITNTMESLGLSPRMLLPKASEDTTLKQPSEKRSLDLRESYVAIEHKS